MSFQLPEIDATALAIADFDLMWCQRYVVAYLNLLKKPQDADDPWIGIELGDEGAELNSLDILARSLVTSIVISYTRPWSSNRDVAGKLSRLPQAIFKDMHEVGNERGTDQPLLPFNQGIHKQVLEARDKVIAHSDHAKWGMQLTSCDHGTESTARDPFRYLLDAEVQQLLENTKSLRSEIHYKKSDALSRYRDARRLGGTDA